MDEKRTYGGLDAFRLIAAFLVIAIHTSPLLSYSDGADFFLTRVLARLAVPFFFMVTGHFVLSSYFYGENGDFTRIYKYILKILAVYAVSIIIYLPLGVYAGNYSGIDIGSALRMIFFDGTFYHIWYFPALIEGLLLVCLLRRFLSVKKCAVVSTVLYAFGLLGDSYYGIAAAVPGLSVIYDLFFNVFSYTRNGIFFTPLFLIIGAYFGESERHRSVESSRCSDAAVSVKNTAIVKDLCCLASAFALMTAEAFTLRYFAVQRHDSMYILLPVCLFFLYRLLILCCRDDEINSNSLCGGSDADSFCKGKSTRRSLNAEMGRKASTFIYVLHPGVIVAVRLIASVTGTREILVENSLIHYMAVSVVTAAASFVLAFLLLRWRRRGK